MSLSVSLSFFGRIVVSNLYSVAGETLCPSVRSFSVRPSHRDRMGGDGGEEKGKKGGGVRGVEKYKERGGRGEKNTKKSSSSSRGGKEGKIAIFFLEKIPWPQNAHYFLRRLLV